MKTLRIVFQALVAGLNLEIVQEEHRIKSLELIKARWSE